MDVNYEIVKEFTRMLEDAETVTEDETTVTLKIQRKHFDALVPLVMMGLLAEAVK